MWRTPPRSSHGARDLHWYRKAFLGVRLWRANALVGGEACEAIDAARAGESLELVLASTF
jgi:hypothetical protein